MLKTHAPVQGPLLAFVEFTDELPEHIDGAALRKWRSWKPPPLGLVKVTVEPTGICRLAGVLPLESCHAYGAGVCTTVTVKGPGSPVASDAEVSLSVATTTHAAARPPMSTRANGCTGAPP